MLMFVYCSTVYNSTVMESNQMPISDRLDKEDVIHIHTPWNGVGSHRKEQDHVFCRDIDKAGSHYPQRTNTGTENQTPRVLTHQWESNNENTWTKGGEHHPLGPVRAGGQEEGKH